MLGNWRHQGHRTGAGIAVAALLLSGWVATAVAQDGPRIRRTALTREEEKGFIDDLEQSRDLRFDGGRHHRPKPTTPMAQPTPEMKKIRPLIGEFQKEMSLLNSQLS